MFLIVYHHTVISNILKTLGVDIRNLGFNPTPKEEEFDRIYCVIPEGRSRNSRLILLRYGEPYQKPSPGGKGR